MSEGLEVAARIGVIGVGGTLVLDIWNAGLKRFLGIPSLDFGLLGRWFGYFPRGRFVHERITATPPIRGERAIGWIAHYAIGLGWAQLRSSSSVVA